MCLGNRAGVRLLMSCMLAKIDDPSVDARQPYTKIGGQECFSGRTIDEQYLGEFITQNDLPCNSTTAFLTPALRNIDKPLNEDVVIVGRPPRVYSDTLKILAAVQSGDESPENVMSETVRILFAMRNAKRERMKSLLQSIQSNDGALPLSSEAIVTLLEQHLACKHSSRLPVLIVAAAYHAASGLGETTRPLLAHNAADEQTGAIGDVEVELVDDDNVVTSYEMKMKRVLSGDIDRAVTKIASLANRIDNYIFITTDEISLDVHEYAASFYEQLHGVEIVVLDCIGFVRHFLHFYHRHRLAFLNQYQTLVLAEPDSAVSQPLKEAWLSLRQAAEAE